MPSSVCSRGDNEMVPHARFEFLECGDAFRGIREQEPLVMRVALYTDDAVADAPLDPRGRNLQGLRHAGDSQPSRDMPLAH